MHLLTFFVVQKIIILTSITIVLKREASSGMKGRLHDGNRISNHDVYLCSCELVNRFREIIPTIKLWSMKIYCVGTIV